ncbi:MAG: signal peptide peptidase SppA [Candidatus Kryptoniota bacterium]
MKKLIMLLLLVSAGRGQDFLVTPQNQRFIFTAGSDRIQSTQYNPSYLGLYNRGASLDAYFFSPKEGTFHFSGYSFHDFGFYGQLGKFGFSYRNAAAYGERSDEYTIGFGAGNEGFAVGASATFLNAFGTSKLIPNLGIIWQNKFFSIGSSLHNFSDRQVALHTIWKEWDIGLGIRPMGTPFLSLYTDAVLYSVGTSYKFGVSLKPLPGLDLFAIYHHNVLSYPAGYTSIPSFYGPPTKILEFHETNTFSIGISFNFSPHFSIGASRSVGPSGNSATFGEAMLTSEIMPSIIRTKRIAEVVIRGAIPDEKEESFLFAKQKKNLFDYVREIEFSASDPTVAALVLKIYPFSQSEEFFSLSGATQELVEAVEKVKESGKKVYAFLTEGAGAEELYLASAANKIYMPAEGIIANYGIDLSLVRLKGFFDKLHITWNAITAGKYKSTFHTTYTDSATKDQAKLIYGLVSDLYQQMIAQVERNRGIHLDSMTRRELASIMSPSEAVRLNIIDGLMYYQDFKKLVSKEVLGKEENKFESPDSKSRYIFEWGEKPSVAVIGIYGTIVTGESSPPSPINIPLLGYGRMTGSETVVSQIRNAVSNPNVKAIVLRVNSGGGSALASDEIYNAVKEAAKEKPVIASFGNVAASGGYYVAAGAKKIFADSATITGSIGVVLAFPELTGFLEKDLGANVEKYSADGFQSALSPFNRWSDVDREYVQKYVSGLYADFLSRVASGRKLPMDSVKNIAEGKVYTGAQAIEIGLVDSSGSLDDAIKYAAKVAGIEKDFAIRFYKVKGLFPIGNLADIQMALFRPAGFF